MFSTLETKKMEAINAQLQQQNELLQEQVALLRKQVNQAKAPGTPTPSPRVEQGIRGVVPRGLVGIHLCPTLPTRGTHNTPRLHHPWTSVNKHKVTQPQLSPRTVVPPQPPTVVRAEGPAPSVRPKQPTLPGRLAHNSSSNTSNNRFATWQTATTAPNPRPQQPLLPIPHNRPTIYPRPLSNLTSRAAPSQMLSIPLTNRFSALQDQHSDTPNLEQAFLVGDSIVRPLQETWRGWDKNGRHKSRKVLCRPGARINDITRQVKNLRC